MENTRKSNELTLNQKNMIEMYLKGGKSAQEIAEENGYKSRQSLYDLLDRKEGKEYFETLKKAAAKGAVGRCINEAINATERLIEISKGNVEEKNKNIVYAILNANNKILEIAGVASAMLLNDSNDNEEGSNDNTTVEDFELFKQMKQMKKNKAI